MARGNGPSTLIDPVIEKSLQMTRASQPERMHPAWWSFVQFCGKLQHGEIEKLRIQDGLPVLAELTTKKVKFT
jgi:hypothetical protein